MKIKVFYPNQQGKLEFTKKELEELLNEAYNEGYCDGDRKHWYSYTYCNSASSLANVASCNAADISDDDCTISSVEAPATYQVNIMSTLDDDRWEGECNCANLS